MVEKLEELHPGELLREEFIQAMGVTIAQVAQGANLHLPQLESFAAGAAPLTGEMAVALAQYFGTSPDFWKNLQAEYDLRVAR